MTRPLTPRDVARYPRPGAAAPRRVEFTPDSRSVTYLFSAEATLVQQLWAYNVATGERRRVTGSGTPRDQHAAVPLDEELRRERGRVREQGVTDYHTVAGEDGVPVTLVPLDGMLYSAHGTAPLASLPGTAGALDARLSPTGSHVAFVRDGDLYVLGTLHAGPPRRLTADAEPALTNGLAEYIAQEEMGRQEGYWWSPTGTHLAYVQADSRHIPSFPITHQGRDVPTVEEHRYPFAGMPNARVRLGVVPIEGGPTIWMAVDADDSYIARVAWRPDAILTVLVQSRDQRTLRLFACDPATGSATLLLEEHGEPWLNLSDDLRFLGTGGFVWSTEESGFRHLWLHDAAGRRVRALTEGAWVVTGVVAVDEERRLVYVHATRESVLERHLYAISLDGGAPRRVTTGAGWHEAVVSPDGTLVIDRYSHLGAAPALRLYRLADGAEVGLLYEDPTATAAALGLAMPELTSLSTADGTTLYAAVYTPPGAAEGTSRFPLVVAVYGGPHVQRVANHWDLTVDMRAQYLAQQGFVVLKVDNRGSANRGLAFEAAIAGNLGAIEVQDQLAGVGFLAQRPYVRGEDVGIYGWSYGGYLTCQALMRAPGVFRVGVAGAPVTHWDGYDTHYTERYMGAPASNEGGYRASSVMAHVDELQGKLLLIHGMVDENVHFRHTARLIQALIAAGKEFDVLPFPEERHMPRDEQGLLYQEQRLIAYFKHHLAARERP